MRRGVRPVDDQIAIPDVDVLAAPGGEWKSCHRAVDGHLGRVAEPACGRRGCHVSALALAGLLPWPAVGSGRCLPILGWRATADFGGRCCPSWFHARWSGRRFRRHTRTASPMRRRRGRRLRWRIIQSGDADAAGCRRQCRLECRDGEPGYVGPQSGRAWNRGR